MSDTKISEFPEKALSSLDAAGTADFVGGYDVVSNNKTNKKFTFATLANWLLTKFKLTIAGSSQTVKTAVDTLNSNMKTFPLSAKNRRMMYLNNADANTLTAEWTLAKGTNFPSYSGVNFWYIHTFAYALASDDPEVISEGRQIAYSYQSANVIFQRSCESGTWTAWTQVPTHAEIEAINSKTLVTFTPETGVRVVENNLVRVGNVVVGNLWLEVTASEKTAKNSTLGSFSQYSLLSFRANANIVDTTKTARGSFKVTSNSNVLVVDNNYALPESGAYNITFCFCTKD